MSYQSMEEAKLRGEKENIPFWKAIQLEDAQERDVKIEDSWEKMKYMWQSMLDALDAYEPDKVSRSGLVGTAVLWTATVKQKNRCVVILLQK